MSSAARLVVRGSWFVVRGSSFDSRSPIPDPRAFTLIELLVVITIIAILAAAIIPNFVGFDTEARLASTQTNLNTLRTRITLFRAKEGRYPDALEALTSTTYDDVGITRLYLDQLPSEMISSKSGNATVENVTSKDGLTGDGGWTYLTNQAKVVVDVTEPLSSRWGASEGQKPSDW